MIKTLYINVITCITVIFLYTGFYLQEGIEDSLSRTANSTVGLVLVIFMLLLLLCTNKSINCKPAIVKPYIILWIFAVIFQTWLTSGSIERTMITTYYVTIWAISFLFFFRISSTSICDEKVVLDRFVIIIAAAATLYSITAYASFRVFGFHGSIGNSYYLLCLLPWTLLLGNGGTKMIIVLILTILILVSMKRTVILVLAIVALVYTQLGKAGSSIIKNSIKGALVFAVGAVLFHYIDMSFLDGHITERFDNIERGADVRSEIRMATLDMFNSSSSIDKLIGHGYNSVLRHSPLGLSAHNDYLETLYDHGIVLFIIQITIIFRLLVLSFHLYKSKSGLFAPLFSSVLIYVISSYATHMILYPFYFLYLSGYWGYIEGKYVTKY